MPFKGDVVHFDQGVFVFRSFVVSVLSFLLAPAMVLTVSSTPLRGEALQARPSLPRVLLARKAREFSVYGALLHGKDPLGSFRPGTSVYDRIPLAQLKDGDVILRLMGGASSLLTAFSALGGYSHLGIIQRSENNVFVVDCQPHNGATRQDHCIKAHPLRRWVRDFKHGEQTFPVLTVLVMRSVHDFDPKNLNAVLDGYVKGNVLFDTDFALGNDDAEKERLYCSEFVWKVFHKVLGVEDLVFYCDAVTNEIIDFIQGLQKRPKYWGLYSMIKVIQKRFKVAIHKVKDLITPSVFEWSPAFRPVSFTAHPEIATGGYHHMLDLYVKTKKTMSLLRSLHGLRSDLDLNAAMELFELPADEKAAVRSVVDAVGPKGEQRHDGNRLTLAYLLRLAKDHATFRDIGNAFVESSASKTFHDPPQ